jgi:hypothetical protein
MTYRHAVISHTLTAHKIFQSDLKSSPDAVFFPKKLEGLQFKFRDFMLAPVPRRLWEDSQIAVNAHQISTKIKNVQKTDFHFLLRIFFHYFLVKMGKNEPDRSNLVSLKCCVFAQK